MSLHNVCRNTNQLIIKIIENNDHDDDNNMGLVRKTMVIGGAFVSLLGLNKKVRGLATDWIWACGAWLGALAAGLLGAIWHSE